MSVHFRGVTPMLVVERVEPTLAFFRDRLGFVVVNDDERSAKEESAIVERGAVRLIIEAWATLDADTPESGIAGPFRAAVYVRVDDVEQLVPEVADADVVVPLRHTAYGMHEIAIREPGGNIVVFGSPLAVRRARN
jgi:catechol 2,3-dioxygenase-like lactoylglutathione lyase family enzyme